MSTEPFEPIETARLKMRCVAPGDAAATSALMAPEVSRWLANWPVPFTPEMAATRIELVRKLAAKGGAMPLAVVSKASDEFAGWVMIHREADDRRRASFGYWLGQAHHGKGYMKEIAPVALAAAFRLLDLDVISAGAHPSNLASLAVMRRCGMKHVGEGLVYASARERKEHCHFYEIERPPMLSPET